MMTMTVQETAQKTGVSVHTLRYYERAGLIPSVGRAANGHRRYSDLDQRWVVFVTRLRATGMPVANIKRYTEMVQRGESTVADRVALLEVHRNAVVKKIEELGRNLALIEAKIAGYREEAKDHPQPTGKEPGCLGAASVGCIDDRGIRIHSKRETET